MIQVIAFVLALAFIYVVKAGAVMLQHKDLAEKSAAFSWVNAEGHDNDATPAWIADEQARASRESRAARGFGGTVRRVGA